MTDDLKLIPIGSVRSALTDRSAAPKQAHEQAPVARLEILPEFAQAAEEIRTGDELGRSQPTHRGLLHALS